MTTPPPWYKDPNYWESELGKAQLAWSKMADEYGPDFDDCGIFIEDWSSAPPDLIKILGDTIRKYYGTQQ